jgi:glutamine amidotransferase-like uncharacterized protein
MMRCLFLVFVSFAEASDHMRIALYGGDGAILGDPNFLYENTLELAASAFGNFSIEVLKNSSDVQQKLTNDTFDVVFFPGGSGSQQASGLGQLGMDTVKTFVSGGGGFIGTCGGAYLGLMHLNLYGNGPEGKGIPAKELGIGKVFIEFSDQGFKDLPLDRHALDGNVSIYYMGGPVVATHDLPSNVSILSWYRVDLPASSWEPSGGRNTPSMTYAEYGVGRVVLNSPHAEHVKSAPGIGPLIYRAEIAWASRHSSASQAIMV